MGIWTWIWTRPPKGTDQLVECKVTGWPPKEPVGTEKPAGTAGTWGSEDSGSQAVSSKGHRPSAHWPMRPHCTCICGGCRLGADPGLECVGQTEAHRGPTPAGRASGTPGGRGLHLSPTDTEEGRGHPTFSRLGSW